MRYSHLVALSETDDILLVDTVGDLPPLFGAASWGVPVVSGPPMEKFAGVSALLVDAGAMIMLAEELRDG